jgi:hypothetical protein
MRHPRRLFPLQRLAEYLIPAHRRLPQRQQRLKDARLAAVIWADEDSNRRGLNRGVLVELEVLEPDAL